MTVLCYLQAVSGKYFCWKWTFLSWKVSHTHCFPGEEDCTDSSSGAYGAEPDLAAVRGGALVSRDCQPHSV